MVSAPKNPPLTGGDAWGIPGAPGAGRATSSGPSAGRSLGWTGTCANQTPMTGTSGNMNAEPGGLYLRSGGL
jgi:hypothetical protein